MVEKQNTLRVAPEFNWSIYEDGYRGQPRLIRNQKISGDDNKNKCFSREPYAQDLFDIYTSTKSVKKDLDKGDCVVVTNLYTLNNGKVMLELSGGLSVECDISREKRFVQMFGYSTTQDFYDAMKNKDYVSDFISYGIHVYVVESSPLKISLWQGYTQKIKDEFMVQIDKPTKAYVAKIIEANKGGFFVEVQGVDAFMPGSLAAPNKIFDFKSYVGKEVIVMIEGFMQDINSFIVSHKKYIDYVLPKRIGELNLNKKYDGNVTGTSKYGIFIEFGDIFTGLLHTSKMKPELLNLFNTGKVKSGDNISFYINEITKDNRIILTEESPEEKNDRISKFILDNKDKTIDAKVSAILQFGFIVNVNDISGLIPAKEFRNKNIQTRDYLIGDIIPVKICEYKDDKLIFDLKS